MKTFTAKELADETDVSRATITRWLHAGRFPGAEKTDDGWRIPLDAVIAAGLHPGQSKPEEPEIKPARKLGGDVMKIDRVEVLEKQVDELERTVVDREHRIALLQVQLAAAEQLAEERSSMLSTLTMALRQIEPPAKKHDGGFLNRLLG